MILYREESVIDNNYIQIMKPSKVQRFNHHLLMSSRFVHHFMVTLNRFHLPIPTFRLSNIITTSQLQEYENSIVVISYLCYLIRFLTVSTLYFITRLDVKVILLNPSNMKVDNVNV